MDVGEVEVEVAQAMQLSATLLWNVLNQSRSKVLIKAGQAEVDDLEARVCSRLYGHNKPSLDFVPAPR